FAEGALGGKGLTLALLAFVINRVGRRAGRGGGPARWPHLSVLSGPCGGGGRGRGGVGRGCPRVRCGRRAGPIRRARSGVACGVGGRAASAWGTRCTASRGVWWPACGPRTTGPGAAGAGGAPPSLDRVVVPSMLRPCFFFFFFKQKTAYEIGQ